MARDVSVFVKCDIPCQMSATKNQLQLFRCRISASKLDRLAVSMTVLVRCIQPDAVCLIVLSNSCVDSQD